MTQVISVVTEQFAVQVADRRLTHPDGRVVTDRSMKCVVLGNRMAMAYTGLAVLGRQRTDKWLAEALRNIGTLHPGQAVANLPEAATQTFAQERLRFPHEFVGVGWVQPNGDRELRPFIARVSNMYSEDGGVLVSPAERFSYRIAVSDRPKQILYRISGQPLPRPLQRMFPRLLVKCMSRGISQRGILQLCVWFVRETAARNSTVSRDLIATTIPFSALDEESPSFMIKGGPSASGAAFLDLAVSGPQRITANPHIVFPGVVLSDVRLEGPPR